MGRGLLYLLFTTLLVACTQDSINEIGIKEDNGADTIYARISDFDIDTRVELNDKRQTVWTENDEICVFDNGTMDIYRFNGKTGDRSGSFSLIESHAISTEDCVFDKPYAVYLADQKVSSYSDHQPALYSTLPSVQEYKKSSYSLNTNAMLGLSENGRDFEFINIFGYLRLSITGDKVVKSIKLEGNNGEIIAGQAHFNTSGIAKANNTSEKAITLDCGEGVQLTDEPTVFYFTIIPTTFNNGISATITFDDDTLFPKRTSNSITISRNTILPIASFNTGDNNVQWQTISISHTGASVSAPYFKGETDLAGLIYWGDSFMSNINYVTSYTYTDNEPSHVITTKTTNATYVKINNCKGITEFDLTNF